MVRVYCKNTGTYAEFQEGTTLLDMLPSFDFEKPWPILACKVNNVLQGLKFRVFNNRDIEYLDYSNYAGRSTYCRSLCFLISKASMDVFPGSCITLRRPVSKGYYCELKKTDHTALSASDVEKIDSRMREIARADIPFRRYEVHAEDAIELFHKIGYDDKVKILQTTDNVYVTYHTLGDTPDMYYDALLPSSGYLDVWKLAPYRGGMILRVPDRHNPSQLAPFFEQPKTFEIFRETTRWNSIMGLSNVGDVNVACKNGHAVDLIQVAEALQERKVVKIAEEIDRRYHSSDKVRLVLITGPSSSGKTTVCKKLCVQLKACGLHPISFSTDDYFVNRLDTAKFPDGSYDFDNFDTVDHDYLQSDLLKLLNGEEVEVPEYNFCTGLREFNGKKLKMEPETVILLEGIHALNPRLTDQVPETCKFRIFINAVTSISLDDHNCVPTSDNRLLRRIVRDYNKGSFSARETIGQWPNVRRAEVKWIYPYQENADVIFNSAYLVEFAVLRNHAEKILSTVPKNCPEFCEADRLLKILAYFTPVPETEIPSTSILREFVGGSSYKY